MKNNVVDGVVVGDVVSSGVVIYKPLKTGEQMLREERLKREHAEKIADRINLHEWEQKEARLKNEQSKYPDTSVTEFEEWKNTSAIGGILQILLVLLIGAGVFYLLAQL